MGEQSAGGELRGEKAKLEEAECGAEGRKMGWNDVVGATEKVANGMLLVLPFFLWGTNMVAMEEVMPKTGAMFVAVARLIPAGALIIAFASLRGKNIPSGARAWSSIALFALINGALFQVSPRLGLCNHGLVICKPCFRHG